MKEASGISPKRSALFAKHILRKLFLEDWPIKLSALLITFALWFGVSYSSKKGTTAITAQVAFRVSEDTVLTNASVPNVTVYVSGDNQEINQLISRDQRVTVDLSDVQPGERTVQLTPNNVTLALPSGVKIDDIQPSRIGVRLEPLERKDIPVKVETVGQPAAGFEVYNTTVTPTTVLVHGPESYVSTLDSISPQPVDITGAKQNITLRQQSVTLPNNKAVIDSPTVDVAVRIGEKRVERTFGLTTAAGKRVTAVLYGPRTLLTKLKPADLKVEMVKSDNGDDAPQLTLPDAMQASVEIRTLKLAG